MTVSKLFQPIKVGDVTLKHRVVMAPLTRFRANAKHVHGDLAVQYYSQRASTPGTLLITEATNISARATGYAHVPSLETDEQVAGWKPVTDAVHAKGSYIYTQIWALGRAADSKYLAEGGHPFVAPSAIPIEGRPTPREITKDEIKAFVGDFARAASNAVHRAGFDGIELHGANGYIIDQFLQTPSNQRTDEYGGSIENRTRFALEVIDAVAKEIGAQKMGIRLSPWGSFQEMRMEDPIPTFSYLIERIIERHPNFGYIHVVEPRVNGSSEREPQPGESNDFIRALWAPRPLISAGGYTRELALDAAETTGDIIAFGRQFISNPDLPLRIKLNIPFSAYDRKTFYKVESPDGYIDYPFATGPEAEKSADADSRAQL